VAEMRLAQQLDPVSATINVDMCLPYYVGRQYDQAVAEGRKAVDLFPNFFLSHIALGQALFEKGETTSGIEELEKARAIEPAPNVMAALGNAYARIGRKAEAQKLITELKEKSKTRYVAAYWLAVIDAGLNENDAAFAELEKAYQERSWWMCWIKRAPGLDNLRSDPRFTDLVHRVGFPQ